MPPRRALTVLLLAGGAAAADDGRRCDPVTSEFKAFLSRPSAGSRDATRVFADEQVVATRAACVATSRDGKRDARARRAESVARPGRRRAGLQRSPAFRELQPSEKDVLSICRRRKRLFEGGVRLSLRVRPRPRAGRDRFL